MKNPNRSQLVTKIRNASLRLQQAGFPEDQYTAWMTACGLPPNEQFMEDRLKGISMEQLKTVRKLVTIFDEYKAKIVA